MLANRPSGHEPQHLARRNRRRLLTHLSVFALAGALCTVFGSSPSGAVQDGRFLEGGNVVVDYTCEGNDQQTDIILGGIGLATFPQQATILSPAVEPSPSPGEDFDMAFTFQWLVDQSLVQTALAAGTTTLNITNATPTMGVAEGATGSDVVGAPPAELLILGDGSQAVGYTHGPFTGTFNRTAAVDSPIVFAPGPVTSDVVTEGGITLKIICNPQQGDVMTLNDQTGVAPSTTTTTLPEVTTTEAQATTTTTGDQVAGAGELPRTGPTTSTLLLVVVAVGLIDVGLLTLRAGQSSRRRATSAI